MALEELPGLAFKASILMHYKSALAAVLLLVVIGMIVPIAYLRWIRLPR